MIEITHNWAFFTLGLFFVLFLWLDGWNIISSWHSTSVLAISLFKYFQRKNENLLFMEFNVMYGVFCIKIDKNQKYIFNCHDFWKLICEDVIDDENFGNILLKFWSVNFSVWYIDIAGGVNIFLMTITFLGPLFFPHQQLKWCSLDLDQHFLNMSTVV